MSRVTAFAVVLYLVGCNAASRAETTPFGSTSVGVTAGDPTSTTSAPSSPTTTTSTGDVSTSADASTSTTFEPAASGSSGSALPDFGDVAPIGCQGKVDVIFAISAQHTMEFAQTRLLAAFPEFAQALEEELDGFDLHVLVTDSSFWWSMDDCSLCQDPADCDPNGMPDLCGATIDECDFTIGAGETFSSEIGSSGRRCKLAGGRRYITREDPDLPAAFDCLARVGWGGASPLPFDSILAAVGHPLIDTGVDLNGPGGCNEGFLRDDALLLVVVIQDTFDQDSFGGPYQWTKALYAVKGGDEDAVFALVITSDVELSPSLCFPGEPPLAAKNRLRLFAEDYIKHGNVESICAPSYGEFFKETAAQVAALCDQFIPK
ncbi:hypothetical protein SAMN02745121_01566 [Nannocystis exedens]|uniref:Uncharacterized protein n=1 Tax=Nannocystis exedens TaxID=54 RepID=A0A1I1V5G2_9BACT|nr:hypothetical protein [Nannocystis exedens]PCC72363.1 hypothetical protein NAEX_05443 [Nannocystis exedens]SFD78267.1 hypothetical protein SAMN02745121_01566 [Nannocystis exedens]